MSAPDAVILALDARWKETKEEERRQAEKPIEEEMGRLERQILETPAEGPAGIAVKLNLALDNMNPDPREKHFDDLDWEIKLIVVALMDADRLAGNA